MLRSFSKSFLSKGYASNLFLFGLVGALILRTGIWYMPNYNSSLAIIQNPFVSPALPEQAQYIFGSWLIHLIAHLLSANTAVKFFALNFTLTALFIGLLYYFSRRFFANSTRNAGFGFLLLLPAVASSIFWVGMDGLTLVLLTLAIFTLLRNKLVWFMVACALLSLQHFEMAVIGLGLLLLSLVIGKHRLESKQVVFGIVTMVFIKACFEFLLGVNSIFYYSRLDWVTERFAESVIMFGVSFPLIVWSGYGALWLLFLTSGFKPRIQSFILTPLVLSLVPVAFSFDQTRTFAVITFPLAAFWLLKKQDWLVAVSSKLGLRNLLLISLIPVVVVWEGVVNSSLIMFDVLLVIDRMFSLGITPPDPALWPFPKRQVL